MDSWSHFWSHFGYVFVLPFLASAAFFGGYADMIVPLCIAILISKEDG